jgi:hypothetical protein
MNELESLVAALFRSAPVKEVLHQTVREAVRAELADQAEEMLDARAAAKLLSMSPVALRRRALRGQIPCKRVGRSLRFRRADLLALDAKRS